MPILTVLGLAALAGLAAIFAPPAPSSALAQETPAAELYETHCAGCHQSGGEGIVGTFPPLAGNPAATDSAYVVTVIKEGQTGAIEVLGVTYDAAMPAVTALTDEEVDLVAAHVVELAGGEPEDAADDELPTPVDAPTVGDVSRGHDLFTGADRLDAGGGSCAACHTAGDVGNLGGWSLGPDLTDTYDRFGGEAGLSAWLANPPSETMVPIFADRPLAEDEIADLVAFLADAPNQDEPADSVDWLTIAAIVGVIVLIGGMAIAWRGMRKPYTQTLHARSSR